jgi:hypothetical protein
VLSLLYVSVSLLARSAERQEVEELVRSAIDHNLRAGITGALVLADGRFAQVLEGPREGVAALMGRIAIDPRHTSVRVVSTSFVSERRFPNWGMIQRRYLPVPLRLSAWRRLSDNASSPGDAGKLIFVLKQRGMPSVAGVLDLTSSLAYPGSPATERHQAPATVEHRHVRSAASNRANDGFIPSGC